VLHNLNRTNRSDWRGIPKRWWNTWITESIVIWLTSRSAKLRRTARLFTSVVFRGNAGIFQATAAPAFRYNFRCLVVETQVPVLGQLRVAAKTIAEGNRGTGLCYLFESLQFLQHLCSNSIDYTGAIHSNMRFFLHVLAFLTLFCARDFFL
jgi:hypothetical protein